MAPAAAARTSGEESFFSRSIIAGRNFFMEWRRGRTSSDELDQRGRENLIVVRGS